MEGNVIIADDDRSLRMILAQALSRAGCKVRATGTLSTLWRWLEDGEGEVLVTDVMMPDGDTLELIPRIKRKRPDMPIIVMSAKNNLNTAMRANQLGAYQYLPKPFDLEHPTKGKGHRLRHACIEGPEVAVYCRGRLKESNVIQLPYYWKDLVHEDSITVQLQPIGSNQNLVIQEFNNEFIVIAEDSTNTDLITDLSTIDCFYHVYGERKDINPLIVEYEGNSWEDYPDPNFDPNKVDEDKKTYNDPRFAGPPNTITT